MLGLETPSSTSTAGCSSCSSSAATYHPGSYLTSKSQGHSSRWKCNPNCGAPWHRVAEPAGYLSKSVPNKRHARDVVGRGSQRSSTDTPVRPSHSLTHSFTHFCLFLTRPFLPCLPTVAYLVPNYYVQGVLLIPLLAIPAGTKLCPLSTRMACS